MSSPFNAANAPNGATAPATSADGITPNDSADLPNAARSLWVGVGGDVRVTTVDGQDQVFKNVADGGIVPCGVRKVWSANTTASDILGLR